MNSIIVNEYYWISESYFFPFFPTGGISETKNVLSGQRARQISIGRAVILRRSRRSRTLAERERYIVREIISGRLPLLRSLSHPVTVVGFWQWCTRPAGRSSSAFVLLEENSLLLFNGTAFCVFWDVGHGHWHWHDVNVWLFFFLSILSSSLFKLFMTLFVGIPWLAYLHCKPYSNRYYSKKRPRSPVRFL